MLPTTAAVEVESPPNESVPDVVMVPPLIGHVVAIDVTVPLPPGVEVATRLPAVSAAINVPAAFARLEIRRPPAIVEVATVPVRLRYCADMSPANVEVPVPQQ